MSGQLYNIDLLRLAARAADWPRLDEASASVERRSPTCGSRIVVDIQVDAEGRVSAFGQEVRACALGQASAALLADAVVGQNAAQLRAAADALDAYLRGSRDDPGDWPGLTVLAPAREYPARQPSIRLAFEATAQAAEEATR